MFPNEGLALGFLTSLHADTRRRNIFLTEKPAVVSQCKWRSVCLEPILRKNDVPYLRTFSQIYYTLLRRSVKMYVKLCVFVYPASIYLYNYGGNMRLFLKGR